MYRNRYGNQLIWYPNDIREKRRAGARKSRVSAILPNEVDGVLSSTHVPFAEVGTGEGMKEDTRRVYC